MSRKVRLSHLFLKPLARSRPPPLNSSSWLRDVWRRHTGWMITPSNTKSGKPRPLFLDVPSHTLPTVEFLVGSEQAETYGVSFRVNPVSHHITTPGMGQMRSKLRSLGARSCRPHGPKTRPCTHTRDLTVALTERQRTDCRTDVTRVLALKTRAWCKHTRTRPLHAYTDRVALEVEVDVHVLAEPRRVVVAVRLCITKGLQDEVGLEQLTNDRG